MFQILFYMSVVVCFATSIIVAVSTVRFFIRQKNVNNELCESVDEEPV